MTEDAVRDKAKEILGFENTETAISGVGQLTTYNQLGFKGVNDKPDGWYLPNERHFPAIILETKNSGVELRQPQIDELLKNCRIVATKYKNVVGILYNGDDVLCFKNCQPAEVVKDLMNKEYYLGLFEEDTIDKQRIYTLTKRINDSLHFKFGINDLKHRMIFTACALVAKRYGATLVKGMDYATFHTSIHSTLAKSLTEAKRLNQKLDLLLEVYADIKLNITNNQQAIDDFIDCVSEISDNINSDFWQGEDVMDIFFNEFTRYKGKAEHGQVFTPDHITSLMYRITETNKDDIVLDAACGSGSFLVKSMCNMVKDAGGKLATVIAPTAHVSKYASIGEGTVVMHQAVVNAGTQSGVGCIVNTFANIEHDVKLGDFCHVSTGAMVNGEAVIGEGTFIGSQSVVNQCVKVCNMTVVASGSVVHKDITEAGIYAGNPIKRVK